MRRTNYVDIAPDDVVLQHSALSFDASTFELWAPLLNGGRLAIAPADLPSAAELSRTIERLGVTTLWLTASMFCEMVEAGVPAFAQLRSLLAGGDVVSPAHARRFLEEHPGCRLINGYGPTENAAFSCCYVVPSPEPSAAACPYGRPIANSSAYVLDERLQPAPFGVVGELCVGGDGVARGYVGLPGLTAERFVPDTFSGIAGGRLYRTGDRVRQGDDGVIEFVGRSDEQVKIRGYRIEPREIEATLLSHPSVAGAAVIVVGESAGDKRIVAAVVPRGGPALRLDGEELRAWLRTRLPAYMLPATIVSVAELPLSPNGKLDRDALAVLARGEPAMAGYRSLTEERVAGLLGEMLETTGLARDVDVFAGLPLAAGGTVRFPCGRSSTWTESARDVRAADRGGDRRTGLRRKPPSAARVAIPHRQDERGRDAHAVHLPARRPVCGRFVRPSARARDIAGSAGVRGGAARNRRPRSAADDRADGGRLRRAAAGSATARTVSSRWFLRQRPRRYKAARILRSEGESVKHLVLMNASPMPQRGLRIFDGLVRRFGLDSRLRPRVRERLCYNLARVHAAVVSGPRQAISAVGRLLSNRARATTPVAEPQPFAKRRGAIDTENSFAHLVAAFTYHPGYYDGTVTLIWGTRSKKRCSTIPRWAGEPSQRRLRSFS